MADDSYSFSQTQTRLEEIVSTVRKKNTSLEASLDLLEEGVRLANRCTELIDRADWEAAATPPSVEQEQDLSPEDADQDVAGTDEGEEPIADVAEWADESDEEEPGSDDDLVDSVDVDDAEDSSEE